MNFRDVELLSAYLDGQLNPPDVARLEVRLASDAELKATLEDLRQTRGLLRRLPQRRAPRSFRLTAKMAGVKPPEPRAYPAFRFASALAAFLFLASVALNAFTPFAASRLAAVPQPGYGMGGGGGGGGAGPGEYETMEAAQQTEQSPAAASGPAATEAPLQAPAPFAQLAPTATAEGTMSVAAATAVAAAPPAQDTARAGAEATEQANKAAPVEPVANTPSTASQPVPAFWMIALGVLMLAFGGAAWWLRANNERRIRSRWNQK